MNEINKRRPTEEELDELAKILNMPEDESGNSPPEKNSDKSLIRT